MSKIPIIRSLGTKNLRTMREEFGYKTINDVVKAYNLGGNKKNKFSKAVQLAAKKMLQEDYNQVAENYNATLPPKLFKPKPLGKSYVLLGDLKEYVFEWIKKKNRGRVTNDFGQEVVRSKSPFSVKLTSNLVANVSHTFDFNNDSHFTEWINKIYDEETQNVDSENTKVYNELKNVFAGLNKVKLNKITGGCNKHSAGKKIMKSPFYNWTLHNPTSKDNNCFFACLTYLTKNAEYTAHKLRKQFELLPGVEVDVDDAYRIINGLKLDIRIREWNTNEELEDCQYMIYKNNHYYALISYDMIEEFDKETKKPKLKIRRGLMTFDFETRPTEDYISVKATGQQMYLLKDTLCCVYYRPVQTYMTLKKTFITNAEKSSARQFLDFLNDEVLEGRHYSIIAHNGSKFDFYFVMGQLTKLELLNSRPAFRGLGIIGLNFRGHSFKDSCCFLADKLSNLSASFKIEEGKMTMMNLHGKQISSEQLCFYKDTLKFNEFLDLQNTDVEFWKLYEEYCMRDCTALFQIWQQFEKCVNTLMDKISPLVKSKCSVMSSSTIGSHSKKILKYINTWKGGDYKEHVLRMAEFAGITYKKVSTFNAIQNRKVQHKQQFIDKEKYDFICNFKTGGISHCNKQGKHMTGIAGVDITSQYSAAMMHAMLPVGASEWIHYYDNTKHGFYLLKNVVFSGKKFKPVAFRPAKTAENTALNWIVNNYKELYVDSYMIKYLYANCNLETFEVVKGLVSSEEIKSELIFGAMVNPFYNEKKLQDEYKASKDPAIKAQLNPALRTTIKLYINSLSGKLIENPARHFSLQFGEQSEAYQACKVFNKGDMTVYDEIPKTTLCGEDVIQKFNEDKVNEFIVAGVMVYSYSKRLLFEYINLLPNKADDVIHVETDGIYFSAKLLDTFTKNLTNYKGDYPCMYGNELGYLKIEKVSPAGIPSYFLGKKFYNININTNYLDKPRDAGDDTGDDKNDNIYKMKGIPTKTIQDDGSATYLVDTRMYELVYQGKEEAKKFKTLKKELLGRRLKICTQTMSRTVKPSGEYELYE